MLWSVKSHHPIATSWSISPSRKRRSNPAQWHHWRVQEEELRRCFAVVTWRLDINSGIRRRSKEKISILRESKLFQSIPVPFEQFKDIHETMLLILHCKTMLYYRNDLQSTYQKVRLTPRVPRVVLKSNSQFGQQGPQRQDTRSSWEPSSDSKSCGEICNNTVDHRISGVPLSAFEPQNTIRENHVKKLIEKFEDHKHKESFFQDLSQT